MNDQFPPISVSQLKDTMARAHINLSGMGLHYSSAMTIHPKRLYKICLELEELRKMKRVRVIHVSALRYCVATQQGIRTQGHDLMTLSTIPMKMAEALDIADGVLRGEGVPDDVRREECLG